ncbi:hypothetical protein H8356DRAFT_1416140 [Neocallimastix lanati (nom. inval.)]|nr:hypothetical protein H8356DRAFT_1416140 [Neocallimastix sp. JGI-2020a]
MSKIISNATTVSFILDDTKKLKEIKKDYVSIEEYNGFVNNVTKEVNAQLSIIIKAQKQACALRSKVLKLIENRSIDMNTAQNVLDQINKILLQNKTNSLHCIKLNRSFKYLDPKIGYRKSKGNSDNRINVINKDKNINKESIQIKTSENSRNNINSIKNQPIKENQSFNNEITSKNQVYFTCNNQLNINENNKEITNKYNKYSKINIIKKVNNKLKVKHNLNQGKNLTYKSNISVTKVKPKLGTSTSKHIYKIYNSKTVAVLISFVLNNITSKSKMRKIKAHSHESDFSPPYHENKNYITYEFH